MAIPLSIANKPSQQPRLAAAAPSTTDSSPLSSSSPPVVQPPTQKYGIPVGVVILPNRCIHPFRSVIKEALNLEHDIPFRGIEKLDDDDTKRMIHLPVQVAAALADGKADIIMDFLSKCGGEYIPGVRMTKSNNKRHRKQQSSHNSNHSPPLLHVPVKNGTSTTTNINNSASSSNSSRFTFCELFAGIGGFRLGLDNLGGKCVLASEMNAHACESYRRHFFGRGDDVLVQGDMLDITADDFPCVPDLLTAGFPCQPFSKRGERNGLDDVDGDNYRGQYYQELVRILMEVRPPYFLFENVVGLLTLEGGRASHANGKHIFQPGRVMCRILEAFEACGYKVEWKVVNACHFVPQYRERVFFLGSLVELQCPDMNWDNILPDDTPPKMLGEYLETNYATSTAVTDCELSVKQWQKLQKIHDGHAVTAARLKVEDYAPTLISSYRNPSASTTRFVMEEADGTKRHGDPLRPRFLTPSEFARIMGFPKDFNVSPPSSNKKKNNEAAIGHLYQGLGNAVVPPVIEAIGRELLRLMELVEREKRKNYPYHDDDTHNEHISS